MNTELWNTNGEGGFLSTFPLLFRILLATCPSKDMAVLARFTAGLMTLSKSLSLLHP